MSRGLEIRRAAGPKSKVSLSSGLVVCQLEKAAALSQ